MAGLAALSSCAWPTHNRATLSAIRAESKTLMVEFPTKNYVSIPKEEWPRVIASLKPYNVTVFSYGVDIMTKPYFDGGYGYLVPKDNAKPPEPIGRFSYLDQGVYWYHPY